MKRTKLLGLLILATVCLTCWTPVVEARGGRGGAGRASMGHFGGGGGRPSMGGGGFSAGRSLPANVSRPSMGQASRPNLPSRSNVPSNLGGGGNFNPGGSRPNISRPTLPGGGTPSLSNRPNIRPPSNTGPVNRPTLPGGGGLGNANLPNINRPAAPNRPPTPGFRPGGGASGERPQLGDRPNLSERPGLGNITRPGEGAPGSGFPGLDRPGGITSRPGGGDGSRFPDRDRPALRPGEGGAGQRWPSGERPVIGGNDWRDRSRDNNRINIGNNVNIGGGNVVIGNRPGWDHGWNNPAWGIHGNWANNWHTNCINPHYRWYNGCWHGYWNSNWYAPLAWGAVGWGLGALTSDWGYGSSYYNPYYTDQAAVASSPYDYSQPVVVNNYASSESGSADSPATTQDTAAAQATSIFDEGLASFKAGDYSGALAKFDSALEKLPGDPVIHEVRALTLFALGEYTPAAAALNSFLSSAPGMDWTTLSSLYGNVNDYQAQLRKLEDYCEANPNDAAAYFVLAYQYLVIGSQDEAIQALQVVVKDQPKDVTAKRMLDALTPPSSSPPATPTTPPAGAPEVDLVGTWQAQAGSTTIELSVTDDSQFTWSAQEPGKPATQLTGQLVATSDQLELESAEQGSLGGTVKPLGPDQWNFVLTGSPPADPGLTFKRMP